MNIPIPHKFIPIPHKFIEVATASDGKYTCYNLIRFRKCVSELLENGVPNYKLFCKFEQLSSFIHGTDRIFYESWQELYIIDIQNHSRELIWKDYVPNYDWFAKSNNFIYIHALDVDLVFLKILFSD